MEAFDSAVFCLARSERLEGAECRSRAEGALANPTLRCCPPLSRRQSRRRMLLVGDGLCVELRRIICNTMTPLQSPLLPLLSAHYPHRPVCLPSLRTQGSETQTKATWGKVRVRRNAHDWQLVREHADSYTQNRKPERELRETYSFELGNASLASLALGGEIGRWLVGVGVG